ncbi:DUF6236 family protein [Acinetobacter pseudolwoffii]|uniref:DUF6236 family protein n=1 Tax=Acinetobacter pseudolwoffii TaxID=2053287 RepID=UPI0021E47EAB|nr:DUF6236 family protein [Acinetobacter pseudolwoffii]
MNRTLITANYAGIFNSKGAVTKGITLEDMMFYSLYWEQLIVPCNNNIYYELPQEKSFIEAGALIRPVIENSSGYAEELNLTASKELITTYNHYKKEDPKNDPCILHNVFNSFDELTGGDLIQVNALRIGLAKILPYPANVNIHDLVEFKRRRKDELEALHFHLTELYLGIVNTIHSQDIKQQQVYEKFDQSLQNLKRAMSEKFPHNILYKDLISDLKDDLGGLSAACVADVALTTFPIGTVGGGISIVTKRLISTILRKQDMDVNLNYIKAAINEGITK